MLTRFFPHRKLGQTVLSSIINVNKSNFEVEIKYRIGAYITIAGGIVCIVQLFLGGRNLIFEEAPNLVVKYGAIILLCNGAIAFPFFGIMHLKGKLTPWYDPNITEVEKARLYVYSAAATLPFFLLIVALIFTTNLVTTSATIIGTLLLIWFAYSVISSIFILLRNK